MATIPLVVYDEQRRNHRPIVEGKEVIHPELIPVSLFPGNIIRQNSDGLYAGDYVMPPVIRVDVVNGVDADLDFVNGTESTVKTLDFILSQVERWQPKQIILKLKAGQVFNLVKSYNIENCHLIFTYFGDPKYPDANLQFQTSTLPPEIQEDLTRPVLTSIFYQHRDLWNIHGLRLKNSKVDCVGVSFAIPGAPATYMLGDNLYSCFSDIFLCTDSEVNLVGSVINKADVLSKFGLYGIESESVNSLKCYATKFFVQGRPAEGADALFIRKYFIKFLSGRYIFNIGTDGYRALPATSQGNVDSTGILKFFYSIISNLNDPVSESRTLYTWPLVDVDSGITNYFYDIRRDHLRRPINIISSVVI